MNLSMALSSTGTQSVLAVRGEVDLHSAPQLQDRLLQVIDKPFVGRRSVVVDLTGVSFLDSTGLGVLVTARNEAERAGTALGLVCTSDRMLKLFRITGLDGVFEIYPSLPGADGAE